MTWAVVLILMALSLGVGFVIGFCAGYDDRR